MGNIVHMDRSKMFSRANLDTIAQKHLGIVLYVREAATVRMGHATTQIARAVGTVPKALTIPLPVLLGATAQPLPKSPSNVPRVSIAHGARAAGV